MGCFMILRVLRGFEAFQDVSIGIREHLLSSRRLRRFLRSSKAFKEVSKDFIRV